MSKVQIKIKNLSFNFGSTQILENINLEFEKNGCYLIIGPNGGGKSTLLNLILSFLKPTTGSIQINKAPCKEFRDQIGFVPQTISFDALFPISVFEFVIMGAISQLHPLGWFPSEQKKRATEVLETMGILELKHHNLAEISGGQRQRALLARALINNPSILMFDEPTTHLDPSASQFIWDFLRSIKKQKTIIMVSHEIPKYLDMIDQVISIQKHAEIIEKNKVCDHFSLGVYH